MTDKNNLRIVAADDKKRRRDFISFPKRLYAGHPGYVAPLDIERLEAIDPNRNPYFTHAKAILFLCYRNDKVVGRISAQLCRLVQEKEKTAIGHFGFLDAIDDPDVFYALFRAAEEWLKAEGATKIQGPFSFSTNEECGQLIAGFDEQPMVMMPFHLPYHGPRIEALNYRKAKDLYAYSVDDKTYKAIGTHRIGEKIREDKRIRFRPANMKALRQDLSLILDIFSDAWRDNWGMVPFTQAEIEMAAKALKPLIDPDLVVIAEIDGEAAGMLVCLPNLLEAIADLNGKLLPFGWAKLLWRLKRKNVKSARIPLMGIRRKHHGTIVGAMLLPLMFERLRVPFLARNLQNVELSWILEDNMPIRRILEGIGAKIYKTYRLYEKEL